MIVIRPITQSDVEAFIEIAFEAGIGMTSMPKNRETLTKRVAAAEKAFNTSIQKPGKDTYLFVLEDLDTHIIGGTCGIVAKTGIGVPLHFYRLETEKLPLPHGLPQQKIPLMRVVHYLEAPTEIGSLYLSPEFRREGLGRLLSLSRFLFMAAFPERFDHMVFAEMRGYIDKNRTSPFWEGIGQHFVDIEFEALMHLRDEEAVDISALLPAHPIYLSILPPEVQAVIGKIHPHTQPALNMLIQEGFYLSEEIDVCDGGPKIEAEVKELRTIKASHLEKVVEIVPSLPSEAPRYIVSNNRLDFRACLSPLLSKGTSGVSIPHETSKALQVQVGDFIRYVTSSGENNRPKP